MRRIAPNGRDENSAATRTTALVPAELAHTAQPTVDMPSPSPSPSPDELARVVLVRPRAERYQVIAEHGRGGLGRVTRAHDRELGRDVAIKELLSRDPVRELRFLREALITARLEHPGIVPVHEAGRWPDGTPFYAMKLVSGRPLRELIRERNEVSERIKLLHHVIAVADAIAYAHDRNIIHRDLKPSNVIVGDFGETVVIDWGLAKDLTTPESSNDSKEPLPSIRSDELTEVGAVLGTPAYMAPEQLRGDPVDQRADVFAIGVMLWELGSTEPLSLVEPARRRHTLHRAGIDDDLISIIAKALDPEPARRYHDAGELAADLKSFKSGARIAARRYSPLAVLAHWLRRHRTVAVSVAFVISLGAAGGIAYIRNIAVERDRADTALVRVAATQHDLAREHAELTLKHAELQLATDPTAALDTLATYQGADRDRASQLRAEATGRGVAVVRATPHTDNVLWAAGMPDGSIVSLGLDGTIARTSGGRTSLLASDMTRGFVYAYAPARHLLAYLCRATLCVLDVAHGTRFATPPEFQRLKPVAVTFSPSGGRLALLSSDGSLQIFDVSDPTRPVQQLQVATDRGDELRFAGEDTVAVDTSAGIQVARMNGSIETLQAPNTWISNVSANAVLLVAPGGEGWLVDLSRLRLAIRQPLCHGVLADLHFLSDLRLAAYSCQDGTVGLWDLSRGTVMPRIHLDGHAEGIAESAAGDYLLAAGGNGVLAVLDRSTDLVTYYRGQGFRLTAIAAPMPGYPYLLSGDVRGGLRAWRLPQRFARVIGDLHQRVGSAIFNPRTQTIVATTTLQATLATFSATGEGGIQFVGPHVPEAFRIAPAPDGNWFAAYGFGAAVELWSTARNTRSALLETHHGAISNVKFTDGADELVTSGEDGTLVRWTLTGAPRSVTRFGQPVTTFALAPATRTAVVGTTDGAIWRATEDGRVSPLGTGRSKPVHMLTLPDQTSVCVGHADGEVSVVDTRSGQHARLVQARDAIHDLVVTPDGNTIAVAANDGTVRVGSRQGNSWLEPGTTWVELTARARKLALTPDGLIVAVCTDGIIWLWSSVRRTWLSLPTGSIPSTVTVTPDGRSAVALDDQGRIISIDLEAVRNLLDTKP